MKTVLFRKLSLMLLTLAAAAPGQEQEVASRHYAGPGGLQGWTLSFRLPQEDGGEYIPDTVVVARHGHILHRFRGDSFIRGWMFQRGGTRVAIETGALHGPSTCILFDVRSGRQLAIQECFTDDPPPTAPSWVKLLGTGDPSVHHDDGP